MRSLARALLAVERLARDDEPLQRGARPLASSSRSGGSAAAASACVGRGLGLRAGRLGDDAQR